MQYIGQFRSIDDILYKIVITTNGDDKTKKDIVLTADPFVTEMDTSDDTIYVPAKYQTATVNVLTNDYLFDIYSTTAQGTKVELYKINEGEIIVGPVVGPTTTGVTTGGTTVGGVTGDETVDVGGDPETIGTGSETTTGETTGGGTTGGGGSTTTGGTGTGQDVKPLEELEWTGYVTPNLYDMGFDEYLEEISVECIDALSTLQYIKYTPVTQQKDITSFISIIDHIIKQCNAYKYFYISDNIQSTVSGSESITENLYISEQNFFNEKDEGQTDNDVAWTCKEVLEEICKFLGVTCIAEGDSVYFIDYDAVKSGRNSYYRYNVDDPTKSKLITISATKKIVASDYSENGATLSLDNIYNKATVKADLYDYDNIFPDFFDNTKNITVEDTKLNADDSVYYLAEYVAGKDPMITFLNWVGGGQKSGSINSAFVKYYKSNDVKTYMYDSNGNEVSLDKLNYTDTMKINGAVLAKQDVTKLKDETNFLDWKVLKMAINKQITEENKPLDQILQMCGKSTLSFSNYVFMFNNSNNHISNDDILKYPFLTTTVKDTTMFFGGDNAYVVISGELYFHSMPAYPYKLPADEVDISNGRKKFDENKYYLLCQLQIGNKFWNGDEWKEDNTTTFKLPITKDYTQKGWNRYDHIMYKDWKFQNTVNWRMGLNKAGYVVKIPHILTGMPTLTIYKPMDFGGETNEYKSIFVALKNFKMESVIGDKTFSGKNEYDTEYTNVIDETYVNELDKIDFKINTWDNKKANYSCVAYRDSTGNFNYVDTLYNRALQTEMIGTTRYNNTTSQDGALRMEEQLIYKITKQYKTPSVKLELNLRNNIVPYMKCTDTTINNKDFIVDAINKDYRNNKATITIIEKK